MRFGALSIGASVNDSMANFIGECLRGACLLEATARKPGNVHPQASFADLNYEHFRSAAEVMPRLCESGHGVGRSVYEVIRAMQPIAPSNANLGIVLLLAPLAAVPVHVPLADGISAVLEGLTVEDAEYVYEAIRLAKPGGLGDAAEQDVAHRPTATLLAVMRLASDRDLVARQYACGFVDVLKFGAPWLAQRTDFCDQWESAIIHLHLELLARQPDSLIARKCGQDLAAEASGRANDVLQAGWPLRSGSSDLLDDFDCWLRADGNRRNPGATADLVAACLFAALRERWIALPAWVRETGSRPDEGQHV